MPGAPAALVGLRAAAAQAALADRLRTGVVANLAVYLRAIYEELGLLACAPGVQAARSFERFFAIEPARPPQPRERLAPGFASLRRGQPAGARRGGPQLGQYGVYFLPAERCADERVALRSDPDALCRRVALGRDIDSVWIDASGLDEAASERVLVAADRILVCVADEVDLRGVASLWQRLARLGVRSDRARILFLGVDRASRSHADGTDPLGWLRGEAARRGWPQLRSFVTDDARVRSALAGELPVSVLHGARGSALDRQLRALAEEIARDLGLSALRPLRRQAVAVRREAALRLAESSAGGWRRRVLARASARPTEAVAPESLRALARGGHA